MKKETEMYVFHDELFYKLIVPYMDRKEKKGCKIELAGENTLFNTHEIILLIILLDYYKKNDGLSVPITLKYIHKCYRNKRTGKKAIMSDSDELAYIEALKGLQSKRINVEVTNCRRRYKVNNSYIYGKNLLKITNWRYLSNGDLEFEYTFGEFGKILLKSKRYSNNIPIEAFYISYQQITFLYIILYLSRLIFINRRKILPTINITIDGMMKRIVLHNKSGNSKNNTLSEVLEQNINNKYTYLKMFKKHLKKVLELLKENGTICSYKINPINSLDDLNIKNYKKCKMKIVINK